MTLAVPIHSQTKNKVVDSSWSKQINRAIRVATSTIGLIFVESLVNSLCSSPDNAKDSNSGKRQYTPSLTSQSACIAKVFTGAVGSIATNSPFPLALSTLSCATEVAASKVKCTSSDCSHTVIPLSAFTPEEQAFLRDFREKELFYKEMSPAILSSFTFIDGESITLPLGVDTNKFISYIKIKFAEAVVYNHPKIKVEMLVAQLFAPSPIDINAFLHKALEKQYSDDIIKKADPVLRSYFSEENKIEDRSIEERMACFSKLRELGSKRAKRAKNKDIVIFFGNTGAGKSTLINFLNGCKMKEEVDERGYPHCFVESCPEQIEVMKIDSSTNSGTILPKKTKIKKEDLEQLASISLNDDNICPFHTAPIDLYDLPGMSDTRGFEVALANICNIMELVNSARSVKVVLLAKDDDLKGKGGPWKSIVQQLNDRFKNKLNAKNVHVVITNPPRDLEFIKKDIAKYANESSSMLNLTECATTYNPMNPADREVQLRLITRNFENLSSDVVLTADEARKAKTLTKDLSVLLAQHFDASNKTELNKVVEFAHNLKILHNDDINEALISVEKTLINKIRSKYSVFGMPTNKPKDIDEIWGKYTSFRNTCSEFEYFMSFNEIDTEMKANVTAAITNYSKSLFEQMPHTTHAEMDAILAKYSEYQTTSTKYKHFMPFNKINQKVLKKLSGICLRYLDGISKAIKDLSGEAARKQERLHETEKTRLDRYIELANITDHIDLLKQRTKEAKKALYKATEKEGIAETALGLGVTTGVATGIYVGVQTITALAGVTALPAMAPVAIGLVAMAGTGTFAGLGAKTASEWLSWRFWPFTEAEPKD